jgi:hypothetical protein
LKAVTYSWLLSRRCRRRNPHARRRHLTGSIHAQFVEHARSRLEIGSQAFDQARDVEEDIAAAIVGAQESKPLASK